MQSRTVYKHLPIPFRVPQRVPHLHHQFATTRVHAHQPSSSGSYDSEGDELLKEFQQYADPNKLQKITKRLELTWSVDRVRTFRIVVCSDWVLPDTKLQTTLTLCCSGVNLPRVIVVMGQAKKSAHGAGAQVQTFLENFAVCSSSVCAKPCPFGAGAMMVGEELFCSLAHGCKQCPICNSKVRSDVFCSGVCFYWLNRPQKHIEPTSRVPSGVPCICCSCCLLSALSTAVHARKQQLCYVSPCT